MVNLVSVNISNSASAEGLEEELTSNARRYGLTRSRVVAEIYKYAVYHKEEFGRPLRSPRPLHGSHISATVPQEVAQQLSAWAKEESARRLDLCRFILEKALEDNLIPRILKARRSSLTSNMGYEGLDPYDADDIPAVGSR